MDVKHYFYYTDEISWYLVLLPDLRSDKLITILNHATSDRLVKLEIRQKDGDIRPFCRVSFFVFHYISERMKPVW